MSMSTTTQRRVGLVDRYCNQPLPFVLKFFRDLGKTVAWQIDQVELDVNDKIVEALGFARPGTDLNQPVAIHQPVDQA